MQWPPTHAELAALSLWQALLVCGCAVVFIVVLRIARRKLHRNVESTPLTRLVHCVRDRREDLFARHHPRQAAGYARQAFLNAVRMRVRVSALFHQDPNS